MLNDIDLYTFKKFLFTDFLRERETSICCSTFLCTHWLTLVCALMGIEPTTLAYWEGALTN